MISVGIGTRTENVGMTRITTPIKIIEKDGSAQTHLIYVETQARFAQYLCMERGDAFLIGLLHYAMSENHDIRFETPVTTELLYQISQNLVPLLVKYDSRLHRIAIHAKTDSSPLPNRKAVGTGISLGVDSLYSIMSHTNSEFPEMDLTHLAFFQVGAHGRGKEAKILHEKHLKDIESFCEKNHYELVRLESNLPDEIHLHHEYVHVYINAFAVFSLQKLWNKYYYASWGEGCEVIDFHKNSRKASGEFSMILESLFSTTNLRMYSDAEHLSRLEKLEALASYPPAFDSLYVCTRKAENCCRCKKCIRTIMEMRVLGILGRFQKAFPSAKCSRLIEITHSIKRILKRDPFYTEILSCSLRRFLHCK